MKHLLLSAALTWVLFMPIAILNGYAREKLYKPRVGELRAHQISTVIAIFLFILLSCLTLQSSVEGATTPQLLATGFFMVCLTILFEFGFGHYYAKESWEHLFRDYDISKGHVWGVFLAVMLVTPLLVANIFL